MGSLVQWVNSFDGLSSQCESLNQLSDGILLFEICTQVAPKYFDLNTLKRDVTDNWVLKSTNIKRILSNLDDYYLNELGYEDEASSIDCNKIAKDENEDEIVQLIELILGVVVECENKAEYIQNIMRLDQTSQMELMSVIQRILSRHQLQTSMKSQSNSAPTSPAFGYLAHSQSNTSTVSEDEENEALFGTGKNLNESLGLFKDDRVSVYMEQIEMLTRERDAFKRKCELSKEDHGNLTSEIETLKSEKSNLVGMIQGLEDALSIAKEEARTASLSTSSDRGQDTFISSSASDNNRNEDEKAQLHAKLDEKDRVIADLKRRSEELKAQASEARKLRDELDLLKEKLSSNEQNEEKAKKYQKKVEEVQGLKTQIKNLQESNDRYIKQTLDLEDSVNKLTVFKSQVDSFKQQIGTLKSDFARSDAESKAAQAEAEILAKKVAAVTGENKSLTARIGNLQEKIDSLESERDESALSSNNNNSFDGGAAMIDPATKEKLMRLERENKRLKEELEEAASKPGEASSSEDTSSVVVELRAQLEVAKKTVERLRTELEAKGTESSGDSELNAENAALKKKIADLQVKQSAVDELIEKLKNSTEKCNALSLDKGRLEGYLRTAKSMIKDLREKLTQMEIEERENAKKKYEDVINAYQTQLMEKDKEIAMLVLRHEEAKTASTREQQLIITAFYNMGMELTRMKAPKIPASQGTTSVGPSTGPSQTPRSLLNSLRNDS